MRLNVTEELEQITMVSSVEAAEAALLLLGILEVKIKDTDLLNTAFTPEFYVRLRLKEAGFNVMLDFTSSYDKELHETLYRQRIFDDTG